jgi:transposase-like protein
MENPMTHPRNVNHAADPYNPNAGTPYDDLIQLVIDHGPDAIAAAFTKLMNTAMLIERQQHLGVGPYQRSDQRLGYANGTKPKQVKTAVGVLDLDVPKTRAVPGREDHFEPFYPQALERGTRACRAVVATLAQMYIQGVSTRDVKKVMAELGLENVSSSQVSRAMATLDTELDHWRSRPLGEVPYLILDARYEKVRENGVVIDVALLTAIGITPEGKRRVLGTSVALSEAEVHWRDFLNSLVARGMRGVAFIASDDHAGLKAARKAVLPAVPWQRCQFHLAQNAIHHCPTQAIRAEIGDWLRPIFNAKDRAEADQLLKDAVEHFLPAAPKLARWLEDNVPEGLTVFMLPAEHRKKMRTTNGIERPIQQELKRRTRNVRVLPNTDSLLRLASAILVEIDDEWSTSTKRYITWQDNMTR